MREKYVEEKLVAHVKARGGLCLKFVSPGWAGAPDRLIILPGGRVGFIEVKAPGKHPRPIQERRAAQLTDLGVPVYTLDNPSQIQEIIDAIQAA